MDEPTRIAKLASMVSESNTGAALDGYDDFFRDLEVRIRSAQQRAAEKVGSELVLLYWQIGREILRRQVKYGWGAKVIDRLAQDLRRAFPGSRGFSARSLKYMLSLARDWSEEEIVQRLLHKLPWGHLCTLHDELDGRVERLWYAERALQHGWSRNVLSMQIETRLHERQGAAITNFETTLPKPQSDLAREILRDPYALDFLNLASDPHERTVERRLVERLRDFLLELGQGFSFVGNQCPLEVGGESFYVDLLFYHIKLRCFVVIELKSGVFRPEHAGKMNFYLSVVDERLRHASDSPSIGLVLCRERNRIVAEYALRDLHKPIGVSQYVLTRFLPKELDGALPDASVLEAELARGECESESNS